MTGEQTVRIAARATAFTVVCDRCVDLDVGEGWNGATFAGRLDLDLEDGLFLCRHGHTVLVQRDRPATEPASSAAA